MNFGNTYLTLHYTNQDVHIFVYNIIISKYCSYIYVVYSNLLIFAKKYLDSKLLVKFIL